MVVPYPKIVLNLHRAYEKLCCKGEPDRFSGEILRYRQTDILLFYYKDNELFCIRMTVQEVADFIETLPAKGSSLTRQNTHLIYLVRDPRGVINSIQVNKITRCFSSKASLIIETLSLFFRVYKLKISWVFSS